MNATILWKSHLYSGHDYCTIQNVGNVWKLSGTALLIIDNLPSRLDYSVHCDSGWQTLSASIEGFVGMKNVNIQVEVNESQDWVINGQVQQDLKGCLDIDLGFTPATNTLPIRRFALEVNESKETTAAWLKIPDFRFSALEQKYSHTAKSKYLYQSRNGSYSTMLSVNNAGLITHYPELWSQQMPHNLNL